MAGHDDRRRRLPHRRTDNTGALEGLDPVRESALVDLLRKLAIARRLTEGNLAKPLPNSHLQRRAAEIEIQLENTALAGEILVELAGHLGQRALQRLVELGAAAWEVDAPQAVRPHAHRQRAQRALINRPVIHAH